MWRGPPRTEITFQRPDGFRKSFRSVHWASCRHDQGFVLRRNKQSANNLRHSDGQRGCAVNHLNPIKLPSDTGPDQTPTRPTASYLRPFASRADGARPMHQQRVLFNQPEIARRMTIPKSTHCKGEMYQIDTFSPLYSRFPDPAGRPQEPVRDRRRRVNRPSRCRRVTQTARFLRH